LAQVLPAACKYCRLLSGLAPSRDFRRRSPLTAQEIG
jgi:hypothetical protein